jgi:hypothetical protein
MNQFLNFRRTNVFILLVALAGSVLIADAGAAAALAPTVDEKELLGVGFKTFAATTTAQRDWIKRMAPGQIRAMQRTGKKFFLYPDAPNNRVYVGGSKEYEAYKQLHPDINLAGQDGAKQASQYRAKQDTAMKKATERDLSDPYYWTNTAT